LSFLSSEEYPKLIAVILFLLFFASAMLYYFYEKKDAKRKRTPRIKPQENLEGKRSSTRLRLKKHDLVFIERITPQEYDKQTTELT
jgi:hypothetical protein